MSNKCQLHVLIDGDLSNRLKQAAIDEDRSETRIVARALDRYLPPLKNSESVLNSSGENN